MKNRDEIKEDVRLCKRFLDELEQSTNVPTTYQKIKETATKHSIPFAVLDLLVMTGVLCGVNANEETVFEPRTGRDHFNYNFFLTDEPDYQLADDLRKVIESEKERQKYVASGEQKNIITELEFDDELRGFVKELFEKGDDDEKFSENKVPEAIQEKRTRIHNIYELRSPAWMEKFCNEVWEKVKSNRK